MTDERYISVERRLDIIENFLANRADEEKNQFLDLYKAHTLNSKIAIVLEALGVWAIAAVLFLK